MYEFWQKHLRPRGYKLKVQIVDFPDGLPGDIGMTLSWLERNYSCWQRPVPHKANEPAAWTRHGSTFAHRTSSQRSK